MITRSRTVWFLLAVWALVFAWSFVALFTTPISGDGFTRGLDRLLALAGWQVVAAAMAFVIWVAGERLGKGAQRNLSRLPLLLSALLAIVVLVVGVATRLSA